VDVQSTSSADDPPGNLVRLEVPKRLVMVKSFLYT